jgi:hypothetical protein
MKAHDKRDYVTVSICLCVGILFITEEEKIFISLFTLHTREFACKTTSPGKFIVVMPFLWADGSHGSFFDIG